MLKEKIVTINDKGNMLKFKVKQLPATEQEKQDNRVFEIGSNFS